MIIRSLALAGLFVSLYAYHVQRHLICGSYKPFCDLSERISCSKSLGSPQGRLFFFPNAFWGVLFYALVLVLSVEAPRWVFPVVMLSVLASSYLAYVTYIVQRNYCIVCNAIYLINLLLLLATW